MSYLSLYFSKKIFKGPSDMSFFFIHKTGYCGNYSHVPSFKLQIWGPVLEVTPASA